MKVVIALVAMISLTVLANLLMKTGADELSGLRISIVGWSRS